MTKYEVQLINDVIVQAAKRGGDLYIPYKADEENLLESMKKLLGRMNLYVKKPYYEIKKVNSLPSGEEILPIYQFVRGVK